MFCTQCGYQMADTDKFCKRCGTPADGKKPEEIKKPDNKKPEKKNFDAEAFKKAIKKNRFVFFALALIFVIVLIAAALRGCNSDSKDSGGKDDRVNAGDIVGDVDFSAEDLITIPDPVHFFSEVTVEFHDVEEEEGNWAVFFTVEGNVETAVSAYAFLLEEYGFGGGFLDDSGDLFGFVYGGETPITFTDSTEADVVLFYAGYDPEKNLSEATVYIRDFSRFDMPAKEQFEGTLPSGVTLTEAKPPVLPNFIPYDSSDRFWSNSWETNHASFWADCFDGELCYVVDEYVDVLLSQGYEIVEFSEEGGTIPGKRWLLMHDDFRGTVTVDMTDWTYYGRQVWISIDWTNDYSMAPLVSDGTSNKKYSVLPNFIECDDSRRFAHSGGGSLLFTAPCKEGELVYVAEDYVDRLVDMGYEIVFDNEDAAHWWVLKHPEVNGVVRIKSLDLGDLIGKYEVEIIPYEDITMDGFQISNANTGSGGGGDDWFDNDSGYEIPEHSKLDCLTCDGTGDCRKCGGDGEVQYYGQESEWSKCPTCHGSGDCTRCGGSGKRE